MANKNNGANKKGETQLGVKKDYKILRVIGKVALWVFCIGVIAVCAIAVAGAMYLAKVTVNDDTLLDINSIQLSYATRLMAYDSETEEWYEYQRLYASDNRLWVDYDDMPAELIETAVWSEDQRFYEHKGVDIQRTIVAFVNEYVLKGYFYDNTQGGSTITQQLIKNITDDKDVSGSSGALRKLREIYRAFMLERRFTKEQILEAYLNTINFGGKVYGIEAAADYYFGTTASELTYAQSASILCITKYPGLYDPYIDAEENKYQREDVVLWFMHEKGALTDAQYQEALAESAAFTFDEPNTTTNLSDQVWSYFTDTAVESVIEDLQKYNGLTPLEAEQLFFNGGLTVYLTMDPKVQSVVEDVAFNGNDYNSRAGNAYYYYGTRGSGYEDTDNYNIWPVEYQKDEGGSYIYDEEGYKVPVEASKQRQSAMVVINYEGEIVGIAGGIREKTGNRSLNRAFGKYALRATGSSIKPLAAYAPAIEMNAIHYSTLFPDRSYMTLNGQPWPRNYNNRYGYYGESVTVYEGVCISLNTTAVFTLGTVGYDYAFDFMESSLGITSLVDDDDGVTDYQGGILSDRGIGLTLGDLTNGISPTHMAGAYMVFGNGGYYIEPHCYMRVVDSYGDVILDKEKLVQNTQAISEETSFIMNKLLQGVFKEGTLTNALVRTDNLAYAGKSGTSSDNKDYWAIGMNPYYVMAVWEGYDQPAYMSNVRPHPTQLAFKAVMSQISADLDTISFPSCDNVYSASFCIDSGDLASAACPNTRIGWYKRGGRAPSVECVHELAPVEIRDEE